MREGVGKQGKVAAHGARRLRAYAAFPISRSETRNRKEKKRGKLKMSKQARVRCIYKDLAT